MNLIVSKKKKRIAKFGALLIIRQICNRKGYNWDLDVKKKVRIS